MNSHARGALRDLFLFSLTAGSADAAGFMGLGHVFTSNMTGNVVLLGIACGEGRFSDAANSIYALAMFLAGACWGAWMSSRIKNEDQSRIIIRVIGCEALLLSIFALFWGFSSPNSLSGTSYLVTFLAVGMGLQASVMYRLNVPGAGTTAITGTLTGLASGAMKVLLPPFGASLEKSETTSYKFQAFVVLFYLAGAAASGVIMTYAPKAVGLIPASTILFVVLSHIRRSRK